MTLEEAEDAIKDMLAGNAFGDAGSRVVIEEFLDGEEASFIVMVDGENVLPMATSQDHKRVGDKDTGPTQGKDLGIIATDAGWNMYVCGNGGMKPRHADRHTIAKPS